MLTTDHRSAALTVCDHGHWQRPRQHPALLDRSGRGLALVEALGRLQLTRSRTGTTAEARIALD
jgi:hypothetical protein